MRPARRGILVAAGAAVGLLLVLLLAGLAIRAAPVPAALRDADPLQARLPLDRPGYLVRPAGAAGGDASAPVYAASPGKLLDRLVAAALAEPRTAVIGGDPAAGRVTLVQRSRLMGYPDVIAIRALPAQGGATVAILSQSRFGGYDWGVNRARVERWMAAVADLAAGAVLAVKGIGGYHLVVRADDAGAVARLRARKRRGAK
ncbi:MAG: DUF1499 domain-containing protein, partial [Rhodobacteraceae bacterium]|nr:DUF1499 domain-containing protein [Paracoccaceae bacterium]